MTDNAGPFSHVFVPAVHGSLSMTLDDPTVRAFLGATMPATVTVSWRARWWQRPWCWIRRRPTRWERRYENLRLSPMEIHEDGTVTVDFKAEQ